MYFGERSFIYLNAETHVQRITDHVRLTGEENDCHQCERLGCTSVCVVWQAERNPMESYTRVVSTIAPRLLIAPPHPSCLQR